MPDSGFGLTTICGAPTLTVAVDVLVNTCGVVAVHWMPESSVTAGANAENWLNSDVSFCKPIVAQRPLLQSSGSDVPFPIAVYDDVGVFELPSCRPRRKSASNVAPSGLLWPWKCTRSNHSTMNWRFGVEPRVS